MTYPRSFSHIGLSVPDINKAVQFYQEVMGWYIVMEPSNVQSVLFSYRSSKHI